ncbi:uncharacterized protein LOC100329081 [Saccoglossus kowalevskii]|uniref:Uncharacterized protein LOC100329081 n=1 Tax=Saccoglossus kowalevskii TaxID=10224 RepID=D2XMS2_SACKO|nr:uncharacterized protein LOC100329081 [Saccoglossus kowalevskii]ADB22409.1 hypothetical protein [Saccoglossus kowalevskii]
MSMASEFESVRPYSRYGYEPPVKSSHIQKTVVYHTAGLGLYGVEHPVGITVRDLSSGNIVQLISRTSGKCVRVNARTLSIDGGGTNGLQSMFVVTNINNDDIVTLRCLSNPAKFLVLKDGELKADGKGGPECRFRYSLVDGQYMNFESVYNPNRFISVYEKGDVRTPAPGKKKRKGQNAHFRVRLMGQSYQTYAN